jgi:hypothetical protein
MLIPEKYCCQKAMELPHVMSADNFHREVTVVKYEYFGETSRMSSGIKYEWYAIM